MTSIKTRINKLAKIAFPNDENTEKINEVKKLIKHLNENKVYDTSCSIGVAYHELPFKAFQTPSYRSDLQKRTDLIKKSIDIKGKKGLDIGCAIGGISFKLAIDGALMTGVDLNEYEIDIARKVEKLNRTGCLFYCEDARNFLKRSDQLKNFDFTIWFSQWMWLVKQYGLDYGKSALFDISANVDDLFFETSIGDAAAGQTMVSYGITSPSAVQNLILENTLYDEAILLNNGPWSNKNRPIFHCKKVRNKKLFGLTSNVKRLNIDTISKHSANSEIIENEIKILNKLTNKHFPKLLSHTDHEILMSYCGQPLTKQNLPEDYSLQCEEILDSLVVADVIHRDINPTNLLVKGGIIMLIDFGYSGQKSLETDRELPNNRNNLPLELGFRTFRAPNYFEDRYSLNKSIEYILKNPSWPINWDPADHR